VTARFDLSCHAIIPIPKPSGIRIIDASTLAEQIVRGNASEFVGVFIIYFGRASTEALCKESEACILDLGGDPCGARDFAA